MRVKAFGSLRGARSALHPGARPQIAAHAVQSPGAFLGDCPPHAVETVDAIRDAVAHSTCAPYAELARDDTLVINPPWSEYPRTTGLGDAVCGVTTDTKYSEEYVRPIAASYETDGSVFLLWERRAKYSDRGDGRTHSEDVCGVTYLKKGSDGKASVIATFRQPSPDEMEEKFKQRSGYMVRPGADNFFEGGPYAQDNPVCEQQMVAAVREYYTCWRAEGAEARLASIASPKLRMKDPVWEVEGRYLPVNRVEAAMFMERAVKDAGESFTLEPKAIAHAEGTNMVFALWFRDGGAQAGIDLFFFGDDLKIASVACFREASAAEKAAHLAPH